MGDVFKELPVRVLGYSFGLAQASRYRFAERRYDMLNGIGTCFVITHCIHTGVTQKSAPALLKTFCFEALCTCIIPPVINYHLCSFVAEIFWDIRGLPNIVKRWAPFCAGVLVCPLLFVFVDPEIDSLIEQMIGG